MLIHPGALSLVGGSVVVFLLMAYASLLALKILVKWDMASSSATQLALERKTYLVSTIMNSVFAFMVVSGLLFIYTADDMHRIFIGAMCATGSLNANPVGWQVLYVKIAVFFIASIWLALNFLDQRAEDYPLVRTKYGLLLLIFPLVVLDGWWQIQYFTGLKPNIITSCCGSLFSEDATGLASGIAALPIQPMMLFFYAAMGLFLLNSFFVLRWRATLFRFGQFFLSILVFILSIGAIISFVSLYYYELPTHHCPFDILQQDYDFIGYPLYLTLFGGTLMGMIAGLVEPFTKIPSLSDSIRQYQRKWTWLSIVLIVFFVVICSWPILFSDFTLQGYF